MRTLAKMLVLGTALGAAAVAIGLEAEAIDLDLDLEDWALHAWTACACMLSLVLMWRFFQREQSSATLERRTQFGLSAVDPSIAAQHMAAWERMPSPAQPECPLQPSPYFAQQYQAYAPPMPPAWVEVMPPAPVQELPFQETLLAEQPVPAPGATTIGYAMSPPVGYDATPMFVRPGAEFDDEDATQFQANYETYVEQAHEHHQRLARGSQPPYVQPMPVPQPAPERPTRAYHELDDDAPRPTVQFRKR